MKTAGRRRKLAARRDVMRNRSRIDHALLRR
jgi:hypothetical protein